MSELTETASSALSEAAEPALTGWSGGAEYFRFAEFDGLCPAAIVDVLRGRVLGAVFRGAVTPAACEQIAARFWASPAGRSRGGQAPIRYLGAYHYHKPTCVYLNECAEIAAAFDEALAVHDDPLDAFYGGLAGVLAGQGITVRRAEHGGMLAARGVLRSWFGRGEFALVPHEDRGQCREPGQSDFEIQRVLGFCICALNICLENGAGGRLRIWNLQPDDVAKRRLGTFYSGSPYPVGALAAIDTIRLDIDQGDIYIFNGSHVHAVEPNILPGTRRTTLSGFFGFIDEATVVSWT